MIEESDRVNSENGDKSPLVLIVPPNSPLIGLRDPHTGLLIVIGCQVAVCPECGSVQLEESWSESGGCFNPECSLSPVISSIQVSQEPAITFPNHKPATLLSEGVMQTSPAAPPPTVLPSTPLSETASAAPSKPEPAIAPPAKPDPPVVASVPAKPEPVPNRPIVTGAAKPPPYIAPPPKPSPLPVVPPAQATPSAPAPKPVATPQPKPVVTPEPLKPSAPATSPITATFPPPITEIPEGWLTPASAVESPSSVAKSPVGEEALPPPPPAFSAAAPPPEGSIIPSPMLVSEGTPEELPSIIAPPIADKLCILCAKPITARERFRICARCGAVHHPECWEANRGCGRPLCGSKVTLAQARPETATDELPPKPFYSDPYGKPHRPSFGESLRTIFSKKEILIGLAAVVVVVVVIFILISAFGQSPEEETKGNVTVTVPSGGNTGIEPATPPQEPSTSIIPGIKSKVIDKTTGKKPTTVETPKVTTPTAPTQPVFPALEESDIRKGLAGVQQNASIRFQNMLKKKGDLRGTIIVTFTVNPDGAVSGLTVAKNTMNDAALGREMESQITSGIKRVRFRHSPKGKTTSFTFSFAPS